MDSAVRKRFAKILDSIDAVLSERITRKRGADGLARLSRRVRHMKQAAGHEAAVRRLGTETALLLRTKAALNRIRDGRFGGCLLCGNPISARHLNAVPWAAFCIPCRSAIDSREGQLKWRRGLGTATAASAGGRSV